jgi:hypothetical protein
VLAFLLLIDKYPSKIHQERDRENFSSREKISAKRVCNSHNISQNETEMTFIYIRSPGVDPLDPQVKDPLTGSFFVSL